MTTRIDNLLQKLLNSNGISDIHLRETQKPWTRKHGSLTVVEDEMEVTREEFLEFMIAHSGETGVDEEIIKKDLKVKGDCDFSCSIGTLRIRGNLYLVDGLWSFAIRKLNDKAPDLAKMGFPPALIEQLNKSKGLFVVTGPTGSGKSTTLAACIEYINTHSHHHIITVEDPVEYKFYSRNCLISQRQVKRDAGDFSTALRAALREDPDILFIGELRDRETVETALSAANTGHFVLGTLHTNNARQSIERIASFFSAEEKQWISNVLAAVLVGCLSQVLVPKADKTGRVLCYELMINNGAVRQAIKDAKTHQITGIMETGSQDGQVLLNKCLLDNVRNGLISFEDALYFAYDQVSLEKEYNGVY